MKKQEKVLRFGGFPAPLPARIAIGSAAIAFSLISIACGPAPEAPSSGVDLGSMTQSKLTTPSYIDSINGVTDLTHGTAHIPRTQDLTVTGWAVDSVAKQPASKVFLDLDGKRYPTQYGVARPDVAAVLKEPAYARSGFTATIPGAIGDGEHQLTIYTVNSEGGSYYVGMKVVFMLQ
jgi:hypothetical protein